MIALSVTLPRLSAALPAASLASLALALVLLAPPVPADAQQPVPADVAEAAAAVAEQARGAMERIDPDRAMPLSDTEAAKLYAGLPSLPSATEPAAAAIMPAPRPGPAPFLVPAPVIEQAPRGPAVRMMAQEVAQSLPSPPPAPAPSAAPAPALTPAPAPAPRQAARRSGEPFIIRSILPIEGAMRYGEWHWDESAAPATGKLVITVDLDARVISAFRDGHEIGTAVALLGTPAHPTPVGNFPILSKERDNVSEKYDNAPMPWTLRLTWNGIAIHGSPVTNGYASHGCIGVPDPFAEKLFAAARRGDRVIITRGRMVGPGDRLL